MDEQRKNKDKRLQNLEPCKPGETANPNGRPKGVKNRSTVIKNIIETDISTPEELEQMIEDMDGRPPKSLSFEDLMVWMQVIKAVKEKDTKAFKAIMDGRYGKPNQSVEHKGNASLTLVSSLADENKSSDTD